jgi:hypothetical protein
LNTAEIYVCLWNERHISLIKLIDANKEKMVKEGWQNIGRTSIGETHHCTFIPAICTLKRASVPIVLMTFDTVALTAVATISTTLPELWWP